MDDSSISEEIMFSLFSLIWLPEKTNHVRVLGFDTVLIPQRFYGNIEILFLSTLYTRSSMGTLFNRIVFGLEIFRIQRALSGSPVAH